MKTKLAELCTALLRLTQSLDWLAPLLMRLFFGYFWAETGWAKLHNLEGATARFVDWGIPFPTFSAPFSAGAEFVGGVLLMLGLFTRLNSIALFINMLVALMIVAIKPVADVDSFFELDEPLYMLIFVWFVFAGPGHVSLDTLLAKWLGIGTQKSA